MSLIEPGASGRGVKTLGIRLEPDLHAQLSLIAQLRGSTITDEIKAALEAHIASTATDATLAGRADSVLEDIEREAAARRQAISTLFGQNPPNEQETAPSTTNRGRGRKTEGGTSES